MKQLLNTKSSEIKQLVQELFLNGIEININLSSHERVNQTKDSILKSHEYIYNATFLFDDFLVAIDILSIENGLLTINEIGISTNINEEQLKQVALKYYVLKNLGYSIKEVNFIHIDNSYVREEKLDIKKLFCIKDITLDTLQLQLNLKENDKFFKENLNIFKNNSENLISTHINKDTTNIKNELAKFMDNSSLPIYYLVFETFQQIVPKWHGISPYQYIPYQYTLYILNEDGTFNHSQFLCKKDIDSRREIAKNLIEDIKENRLILVNNAGFEKEIIRKLANLFGEYTYDLMNIHDNIKEI